MAAMFTAVLGKFGGKLEKTGWTHIEIPMDVAGAKLAQPNAGFEPNF